MLRSVTQDEVLSPLGSYPGRKLCDMNGRDSYPCLRRCISVDTRGPELGTSGGKHVFRSPSSSRKVEGIILGAFGGQNWPCDGHAGIMPKRCGLAVSH